MKFAYRESRLAWAVGLGLALLLGPALSHAEERGGREREALRRVQAALRSSQESLSSLESEKARLSSEKSALAQDNGKLVAEARKLTSRAQSVTMELQRAQSRQAELEGLLSAEKSELISLKAAHADLSAKLREQQQAVAVLRNLLTNSTAEKASLVKQNERLFETGVAIVDVFRSQNPLSTLASREPFLGLGRIQVNNIAEVWLDRLEDARYKADTQAIATLEAR